MDTEKDFEEFLDRISFYLRYHYGVSMESDVLNSDKISIEYNGVVHFLELAIFINAYQKWSFEYTANYVLNRCKGE